MEWKQVARAVRRRREELGLTQEQAAAASEGAVSTANWRVIENAKRQSYRRGTLLGVCRALRWTDDSIDRILEGEQPVAVRQFETAVGDFGPGVDDLVERLNAVEERLAVLERVIEGLKAPRNGTH